jgi:uncharacterized protein YabN with tetrapyrrole methylase and pyrophosphatase domain
LGVSLPDHLTVETSHVLATCTRIFTLVREPPAVWLPSGAVDIPVINIFDMYAEGALRTDNYERVANHIIRALDETEVVGYVTYGNPFVYDSVSQHLARHAERLAIPFRVVAAISSIDTLLCDLRADMAPGIQIYEASWLVAAQIPLNVTAPAILVQLGTFGSFRAHYRDQQSIQPLTALSEYLCSLYPPSHGVVLVRSRDRMQASEIRRMALAQLADLPQDGFLGASMYLPALRAPKLSNEAVNEMAKR